MNVFESIKKATVEVMGISPEDFQMTTNFYLDLDADSLDLSQILIALENEYTVDLPAEEIADIETVEALVRYVEEKIHEKH